MSDMRDRLGRLPLERRTRFLALLRSGRDGGAGTRPVRRGPGDPAPLSYAQGRLWTLDKVSPGSNTYNVILALRLQGRLDPRALAEALSDLVARHEPLRTRLPELASGPAQVVDPPAPVELTVVDAPGDDLTARRAAGDELAQTFSLATFDLEQGPLWRATVYRVDPHEHLFVFVVHHIVFDGTSADVLLRDLAELYRARVTGAHPDLPPLTVQFADFAAWERAELTGERSERLTAFWRERLRDAPLLELPADRPRPADPTQRGALTTRPLDRAVIMGVRRLANRLGITTYPVYLAAFAALLQRHTGQEDLVVGCSTSVRTRPELEHLVGFFLNLLPLRLAVSDGRGFTDLVRHADQVLKESLAHVQLPFDEMVKAAAPARERAGTPLTNVAFLCQGDPRLPSFHDLSVGYEHVVTHTTKNDMTWLVAETGADPVVGVEYSTDLFDRPTVDAMVERYERLLRAFVEAPERAIGDAELTSEQERAELIRCGAGPTRPVRPVTVHEWFAEQAARTPDQVAVVAGDRRLTYAELDRAANRLARQLRRDGVGPEQRVALLLPRGIDHPIAALATLKAGGAFVPLDPAHPVERISALLADVLPAVVVTDPEHLTAVPDGEWTVRTVADSVAGPDDESVPAPPPTAGPVNLAYIIYTSGSTGTPKGVLVEHRNVVNFIESVRDLFDLGPADRVLAYASYTFDVSIFEMFAALLTGGQLHVALEHERLDLDRLQSLLHDAGITVIDLPPSVMALLDPEPLDRLRVAFVGGEAFPGALVNRWNKVARFVNGYGPTEGTVTMIAQDCDGDWAGSPPIGLPMANHVAYVVDERLRPVPYGVTGELVIGGSGLARGYLRRPAATREKFVPDPFGATPDGRLYRTGDLVRRQRTGELVFVGRLDRQIKLRGIRIEPGEIESVLAGHPAVRQALVDVWTDPAGNRHLVAYAAVPPGAGVAAPTPKELRRHLAAKLPAAVVPSHVVVLDELPLTSSGKADRSRLPAPAPVTAEPAPMAVEPVPMAVEPVPVVEAVPVAEPVPVVEPDPVPVHAAVAEASPEPSLSAVPETPVTPAPAARAMTQTERILAGELFAALFGRTDIGPADDFFELGGASLQAAQLISAIRRRFEVDISVADFFLDPTVAGLATVVDRQRALALDDDQILDLIEGMSDDMVEQLMGSSGTGGEA